MSFVNPDELTDFERGLLHDGLPSLPSVDFPLLRGGVKRQAQADDTPVLALMPDGTGFAGPRWLAEVEKHVIGQQLAWDRAMKTGENIHEGLISGLGWHAAVAHDWDPDWWSDLTSFGDAASFVLAPHPLNSESVVGGPRDVIHGAPTYERSTPVEREAAIPRIDPASRRAGEAKEVRPPVIAEPKAAKQAAPATIEPRATQRTEAKPPPTARSTTPSNRMVPVTIEGAPLEVEETRLGPGVTRRRAAPAAPGKPKEPSVEPKPAEPLAGGKKQPAAPPASGKKQPPAPVETPAATAARRNNRGLPAEARVRFENQDLNTIADELEALHSVLRQTGKGKLIAHIDRSTLPLSPTEFMQLLADSGRPELQNTFNRLLAYARSEAKAGRRRLLEEEIPAFLNSGVMGSRRISTVDFRLDRDEIVVTDASVETNDEAAVMQRFKAFFDGEAIVGLVRPAPAKETVPGRNWRKEEREHIQTLIDNKGLEYVAQDKKVDIARARREPLQRRSNLAKARGDVEEYDRLQALLEPLNEEYDAELFARRQISQDLSTLRQLLRSTTPAYFDALTARASREQSYKDVKAGPLHSAFKPMPGPYWVEHVYPRSKIFMTPGFLDTLNYDQQTFLFSLPEGLILAPAEFNRDRGVSPYAKLTGPLRSYITDDGARDLATLEANVQSDIEQLIKSPGDVSLWRKYGYTGPFR